MYLLQGQLQHTGCTAIRLLYRYMTRYELNACGPMRWPNGPFWAGPEKSGPSDWADGPFGPLLGRLITRQ